MPPTGQRIREFHQVLGAHQGGGAQQRPLPGRALEARQRAETGHQAEADAVVEPVQRVGRQPAGGDRAGHRQLGRQGRQHMAEQEDAGRAQPAHAPLQGAEHRGERPAEEGPEPAGDPQGAGEQDDQRPVGQVGRVGAGVAQQLVDGGLVAELGVDRGAEQDEAVAEGEGRGPRGGDQLPQPVEAAAERARRPSAPSAGGAADGRRGRARLGGISGGHSAGLPSVDVPGACPGLPGTFRTARPAAGRSTNSTGPGVSPTRLRSVNKPTPVNLLTFGCVRRTSTVSGGLPCPSRMSRTIP